MPDSVAGIAGETPLLIIVPVRAGSKRLPNKHVLPLCGETLLQHTARHIAEADLGAMVLLTTDSEEIAAAGRSLGWIAPFLRPADLSSDSAATVDAVMHALDWFRTEHGSDPEITLLVQVTSPLRKPERLASAAEKLRGSAQLDAVVGVCEAAPTTEFLLVASNDMLAPLPLDASGPVYRLNGAIYAIRTAALRLHRSFEPPQTGLLEMPMIESIDVDDREDWQLAEALLAVQAR